MSMMDNKSGAAKAAHRITIFGILRGNSLKIITC